MDKDDYPNILLVDDLPENILTLESMLEDLPINIHTEMSGDSSLKYLLKNKIDLLILDICMPGISGIEVATYLKGLQKTKDIPIIFLSGSLEDNYLKFKKQFPNNVDFLYKPIDYNGLLNKVKTILNIT
jgi:CheY-like chemotaxis protein